jgi:hypothetical protein
MNDHTISRTRIAAAASLAAGAVLAGTLGSAASANAAPDLYIALAYSFQSDVSGIAVTGDMEQSRINALANCQDKGGNHCVSFALEKNTCAALAILGQQEWNTATGATTKDAENQALAQNPGSHIAVSGCTSGRPWTRVVPGPYHPLTPAVIAAG